MRYAIFLAALLAAGCGKKELEISPTDNAEVKVERLFDHDGCTVYRFYDAGTRYFAKCRDGSTRTEWSESYPCGKSVCRRDMAVPGV